MITSWQTHSTIDRSLVGYLQKTIPFEFCHLAPSRTKSSRGPRKSYRSPLQGSTILL